MTCRNTKSKKPKQNQPPIRENGWYTTAMLVPNANHYKEIELVMPKGTY